MSFLRNIRNSISRGGSSTRDSTPNSRRSSSVDSNPNPKDPAEIRKVGEGLQRSETFTLEDDKGKEKTKKKEKVLSKFSTFTKRKKAAAPHPPMEEIQKNTYYKWRSGIVADEEEAVRDPFNVLYEQPSSLKSDLSGHSDSGSHRRSAHIDTATYRKNRVPRQLREQLDQMKNQPDISEEVENDPDKFRTITINSFRKSFRDKFLATQNDVPHNPAWFVEVESPPGGASADRGSVKQSRPDVFVFENENYRPTSRSPGRNRTPLRTTSPLRNKSPIRGEAGHEDKLPVRSTARSAVKRTDTFKIERPLATEPSIRIEIKNSITPNQPGRLVPVGVAKPMPAQSPSQPHRVPRFESPARGAWTHQSPARRGRELLKPGRYQTCIHIRANDEPAVGKEPTRIQITARSPLRYFTGRKADPAPTAKKQTYFGDNLPRETHPASVKSRQYIQHPDVPSYARPSRPTSGLIGRNETSRVSMTQAVPRRSRSPIKAPWR